MTNLQLLHPAVLVSYMIMMYISIFPVAISIRRTNVYEEKSLGIYAADREENTSFTGIVPMIRQSENSNAYTSTTGIRFVVCISGAIYNMYR